MQDTNEIETEEIHSHATVAGHPIHPMLVVFPIAFLVGILITDVTFMFTRDLFWAQASYWLIIASIIGGILAALLGIVDFVLSSRIRRLRAAWIHGFGNILIIILTIFNLLIRDNDVSEAIFPWGILLSAFIVVLLTVTGWYGGELVYKHAVGINTDLSKN